MKKVDLGCGSGKLPEHIGVDVSPLEGVDYVVDVRNGMPFLDGEIDEIFTSHFLEHLTGPECLKLLKECHRVLAPTGTMEIIVPDFVWCLEAFLKESEETRWGYPAQRIFGQQTNSGELHKNGFTNERLTAMLNDAGFDVQGLVPIWTHSQRSILAKVRKKNG